MVRVHTYVLLRYERAHVNRVALMELCVTILFVESSSYKNCITTKFLIGPIQELINVD